MDCLKKIILSESSPVKPLPYPLLYLLFGFIAEFPL